MSNNSNKHFHKKTGAKPGTLIYTGNYTKEKTEFSLIKYNENDIIETPLVPASFIPKHETNHVLWYIYSGLNESAYFEKVCNDFHIPSLMQEDILHTRQRPKIEILKGKSLSIIPIPRLEDEKLVWQQVSLYHHKDEIITFMERKSPTLEIIKERIRNKDTKICKNRSDFLLYILMDAIVDQYLNITQYLINETDELEIELLSSGGKVSKNFVQELYNRKKDLLNLLKRINQIEGLATDLKTYFESVEELNQGYIVDLLDHVYRIRDNLNHLRQLMNELMNQYLAINGTLMNEIMKTLTVFSAVFIPLSFIVGLYGMNFNTEISPYNMPELSWKYGYPTVLGVMGAFTISLLIYLKKRNWL